MIYLYFFIYFKYYISNIYYLFKIKIKLFKDKYMYILKTITFQIYLYKKRLFLFIQKSRWSRISKKTYWILGEFYAGGIWVEQDRKKSLFYLHEAVRLGYADSYSYLGKI